MNYGASYQNQTPSQAYNPYQDPNQAYQDPNQAYQEDYQAYPDQAYQDDPRQTKTGSFSPWVVGGVAGAATAATLLAAYKAYLAYQAYQAYQDVYPLVMRPPFDDVPSDISFWPDSSFNGFVDINSSFSTF